MHSTFSFAAFLAPALLAAPAFASPVMSRDASCPKADHFSKNDWCSTKKDDNVIILASDNKISYGNINPGDIIGSVRDHCSNGVCDTDWSLDTMWVKDKQVTNGKIKVKVATQVVDTVHLKPMLESLQWTLDQLKEFKKEEWLKPVVCSSMGQCPQPTKHEEEQTKGTAGITIQVREKDNKNDIYERPIVSSLTITLTPEMDDVDKVLCQVMTTIGAAVAKAVNPVLGVIGGLSQLGCMAL